MRGLDVVLMSWFVGIEQENISLQEMFWCGNILAKLRMENKLISLN